MKTNALPIKAFLGALGAIFVIPVSAVFAAASFTLTGILAVFLADYGRTIEPLRVRAAVLPFEARGCTSDDLRTAA